MSEKELSGLYYLNRETERLQKDLDELEDGTYAKSPVYRHGSKNPKKYDISHLAVEIADLKEIIQLNLRKIQIERARLLRYIQKIEDPEIRLIFRLRHVNGMTWREIADEVHMDFTTANRKHRQYLKNATNAT